MNPIDFGKYRLLEKIGQGGMAEVFYAHIRGQEGFTKEVALKRVLQHLCEDADFVKSFIDEARLGGLLNHHHIVQTLDFGQEEGVYFIAMEYVHGLTLREIINFHNKNRQVIPPTIVLELLLQLADGLRYAHKAEDEIGNPLNMVHRDLKPTNILVSSYGAIKIADFGIARAETNLRRTTYDGVLKGTAQYMSPEQALGDLRIDQRSDIFSVGSIAYEMVTLRSLFYDPNNSIKTLRNVQDANVVEPLAAMLRDFPYTQRLAPLLEWMLHRDPHKRPAHIDDVMPELRRLQSTLTRQVDTQTWIEQVLTGLGRPVRSRRSTASRVSIPVIPQQAFGGTSQPSGPVAAASLGPAAAPASAAPAPSPGAASRVPPATQMETPLFGNRSAAGSAPGGNSGAGTAASTPAGAASRPLLGTSAPQPMLGPLAGASSGQKGAAPALPQDEPEERTSFSLELDEEEDEAARTLALSAKEAQLRAAQLKGSATTLQSTGPVVETPSGSRKVLTEAGVGNVPIVPPPAAVKVPVAPLPYGNAGLMGTPDARAKAAVPPAAPRAAGGGMNLPPPKMMEPDDWSDVRTTAINLKDAPPGFMKVPLAPVPAPTPVPAPIAVPVPVPAPVRSKAMPAVAPSMPPPFSPSMDDWADLRTKAISVEEQISYARQGGSSDETAPDAFSAFEGFGDTSSSGLTSWPQVPTQPKAPPPVAPGTPPAPTPTPSPTAQAVKPRSEQPFSPAIAPTQLMVAPPFQKGGGAASSNPAQGPQRSGTGNSAGTAGGTAGGTGTPHPSSPGYSLASGQAYGSPAPAQRPVAPPGHQAPGYPPTGHGHPNTQPQPSGWRAPTGAPSSMQQQGMQQPGMQQQGMQQQGVQQPGMQQHGMHGTAQNMVAPGARAGQPQGVAPKTGSPAKTPLWMVGVLLLGLVGVGVLIALFGLR